MGYHKIFMFRPNPIVDLGVDLIPTGMGILAEELEEANVAYEVLDMALGYEEKDLMEAISKCQPDLIACSLISFMYLDAYALLNRVKAQFSQVPIVVGGPHVSMFGEKVLKECEAIDFAIVKEGEEPFMELVKGKDPGSIKGMYRRKGEEILFNGERPLIKDLNKFPFPKYRKFELEKYTPIIPIYSSRGCPYKCIFCGIKDVIGMNFRARNNDHLMEELTFWYESGFRRISFSDDNFTCNPKRIFDLCQRIKDAGITDVDFSVWDTRADSTSRELLVEMKDVGFSTLLVGVESGSNRVLEIIKKGETIEEIERMVKDAIELGFDIQLSFLIGSPYETVKEVEESFKFALKYPIKGASFFNLVPTPNTELLEYLEENNLLKIKPEVYLNSNINTKKTPLFGTPEIPVKERVKLLKRSKAVEHKIIINYFIHKFNLQRYGVLSRVVMNIILNRLVYRWIYRNQATKQLIKRILKPKG